MSLLLSPRALLRLACDSVSDPRGGARFLMGLNLPQSVVLQFYLLIMVLSAMLKVVYFGAAPMPEGYDIPPEAAVSYTIFEAVLGLGFALAAHLIGRGFGGSGSFLQALTLVTWVQFVLLLVSAAQIVLAFVMPPLVDLTSLFAVALFFWLMTHFITELHGFSSPGLVFAGILLTFFGLAILLTILLSALGLRLV